MEEIDKILVKMHYRLKREVINDLLKEHKKKYKEETKIVNKLKKMLDKVPTNV